MFIYIGTRVQLQRTGKPSGGGNGLVGDVYIPEYSCRGQANLLMEDQGWKEKMEADANEVSVSQNLGRYRIYVFMFNTTSAVHRYFTSEIS